MRQAAAGSSRPLILLYENPDPDSLGAALALCRLLKVPRKSCTIAYTGEVGRPENKALIRTLRIPAVPFKEDMLDYHDFFAMVDAQPYFFRQNPDLARHHFNVVIDHHPRRKGYNAEFIDVRPSFGSTCTIMTEYIRQSRVKMSRDLATALYYGLETDTASLQRVATDADIEAFRFLRNRADMNIIKKIQQSHFPLHVLDYFGTAIIKKHVVGDVIFSYLGMVEVSDVCVHVADFFTGIYEISWVVVAGVVEDTLIVVVRSDGFKKDAGRLVIKSFSELGSAGGHITMARAEAPLGNLKKHLSKFTNINIEKFLLSRMGPHLPALRKIKLR